jgi:quercetin dioxygenase-like cupin family protein
MRFVPASVANTVVAVVSVAGTAALTPTRVAAQAQVQTQEQTLTSLPAGAKITVMQGTPSTGPSTMLMTLPAGYAVALHRHPTDESIVVRSGTYIITYGAVVQTLSAGQSATIKANTVHSERAQGPTVIEVQSAGAFKITYVPTTTTPKAVTP